MYVQVLHELETAHGTLRLEDLAARVGMEPSALKGMLDFWVRKGRLRMGDTGVDGLACSGSCGQSCPGAAECVFVAKMPAMYGVVGKVNR
jgi:hypothetical protein